MANPNKTKPILDILLRNKEKLIDFLTKFHTDRTGGHTRSLKLGKSCLYNYIFVCFAEDQQFNDEKQYLIKQIRDMQPSTVAPPTGGAAAVPV